MLYSAAPAAMACVWVPSAAIWTLPFRMRPGTLARLCLVNPLRLKEEGPALAGETYGVSAGETLDFYCNC